METGVFWFAHVLSERLMEDTRGVLVRIYPVESGFSGRFYRYHIYLSRNDKFITSCPATLTRSQYNNLVESVRLAGLFE